MLRLLPRDETFYDEIERLSDLVLTSASVMDKLVSSFPSTDGLPGKIEQTRCDANRVMQDTLLRLDDAFITPLDREDIMQLGHGTNDAQKTMGVIVALLIAGGHKQWTTASSTFLGQKHEIAWWIILSCHAAMALGTLAGGWRIVQTMGSRITPHLRPVGGFSAEVAAASTIAMATFAKVPISTTHAIGGAVSGVGATRSLHYVRWIWGKRIVLAWILTFPGATLIGAGAFFVARLVLEPHFGHIQVK